MGLLKGEKATVCNGTTCSVPDKRGVPGQRPKKVGSLT